MRPKILFTDIDGTLLNINRELSFNTKKEVTRIYTTFSTPIILVSARMPKSMRLLQQDLNLQSELICYNGALVLGSIDSHILHEEKISPENSFRIIEMANQLNLHFSIFCNNSWMINKNDEWANRETQNTKVIPSNYNASKFDELLTNGLHKIMLMGNEQNIDQIQKAINESHEIKVTSYRSKNTYLEISPFSSTKFTAILKILSLYKIDLVDSMAIGDNHNDLEMIQKSGIGVAVENAPTEIKKHAKFICPSNLNDGVAITIKKYFPDEDIPKSQQ